MSDSRASLVLRRGVERGEVKSHNGGRKNSRDFRLDLSSRGIFGSFLYNNYESKSFSTVLPFFLTSSKATK